MKTILILITAVIIVFLLMNNQEVKQSNYENTLFTQENPQSQIIR